MESAEGAPAGRPERGELVRAVIGYSALRLLLLVGLTVVLYYLPRLAGVQLPLIMAVLLAVVLQLPMAWLLFARPRLRVTALLAARSADRRSERDRLRSALAGDDTTAADEVPRD